MNRRQLLGAAIAAPFAGNVIPFPTPAPKVADATLTALEALSWNSSRTFTETMLKDAIRDCWRNAPPQPDFIVVDGIYATGSPELWWR